MDDAPTPEEDPPNLKFLRILVTVLTATMIAGVLVIIALLVIRLQTRPDPVALPDHIALPEGITVTAFTAGPDWYAVVTGDNHILIYNTGDGTLRQEITVKPEN